MVIGDLNMPRAEPSDPIYRALKKDGLKIPEHGTRVGTTIANVSHYDQVAFFKGATSDAFIAAGVHSFDNAILPDLWSARGEVAFDAYLRFHLSDHRPIWIQFAL